MKLLKHYEQTLRHMLQPFVYSGEFPAAEAARILHYLDGDSVESIMSLSPDQVTKAARQRLFDEAEAKWIKRKVKNQKAAERARAKRQATAQEAHEQVN
jgi:hypothetical protein